MCNGVRYMNIEEYNNKFNSLNNELNMANINVKTVEEIDQLYDMKPVSMRWHVLKCKSMVKKGHIMGAIKKYSSMINYEYAFEGNIELWQEVIEAYSKADQKWESKKLQYMLSNLIAGQFHSELDRQLITARQRFMEGDESLENLNSLEEFYYVTCNYLIAYTIYLQKVRLYPEHEDKDRESMYLNIPNMAYFSEYIFDKKIVILVVDGEAEEDYDILSYILHGMGCKIYMICDTVEVEEEFEIKDSVQVSIENAQEYEDCIAISAVAKIRNGKYIENNISYIINYICQYATEDNFAITLTSNQLIEKLRIHEETMGRFERMSKYEAGYIENKIGFGRAGDYFTYINRLYEIDSKSLLDRKSECRFSIVVPVRNATDTLYYTLRTCLEQEYEGEYEILVSDNSAPEHTVAYDICKKLNNKHIRYIKTPRELCLAKSFEYAYLNAKGQYIVSIGADDGLLPWSLKSLDVVWSQETNINRNIISWDRGFYAWPGFNGGQQHQLVIPNQYEKGKISGKLNRSKDYIAMIIKNPDTMYSLPNMYINSGFRRGYLKEIYKRTGEILSGSAQDIYMGLLNLGLNDEILHLEYPISIAGMSNSSVGAICNKSSTDIDVESTDNMQMVRGATGLCAYVCGDESRKFPMLMTDVSGMYMSLAKLAARRILPSIPDEEIEIYKVIYSNMYKTVGILSDKYYMNIYEGYEKVKKISDDLGKWYQQSIMCNIEELRYITSDDIEKHKTTKKYKEGFIAPGGVTLDASRYDVTNIYEAVQLFKEFLNF